MIGIRRRSSWAPATGSSWDRPMASAWAASRPWREPRPTPTAAERRGSPRARRRRSTPRDRSCRAEPARLRPRHPSCPSQASRGRAGRPRAAARCRRRCSAHGPSSARRMTSPGRARPTAWPIASRRSSITHSPSPSAAPAARAPSAICSITRRSSRRGSSSVTTMRSASSPPRAPSAPACGVTLAGGAEDDDQPPFGDRSQDHEHLAERVGGVRVVDDNRTADRRQPAPCVRHLTGVGQRRRGGPEVQPERLDHAERRERVRHIEAARQGNAPRSGPARGREIECRAAGVGGKVPGADIGPGVRRT